MATPNKISGLIVSVPAAALSDTDGLEVSQGIGTTPATKGLQFSQIWTWIQSKLGITTGTWTPTDASGAGLSFTVTDCNYRICNKVCTVSGSITFPVTANGTGAQFAGLPVAVKSGTNPVAGGGVAFTTYTAFISLACFQNTTHFSPYTVSGTQLTNANLSGKQITFTFSYITN